MPPHFRLHHLNFSAGKKHSDITLNRKGHSLIEIFKIHWHRYIFLCYCVYKNVMFVRIKKPPGFPNLRVDIRKEKVTIEGCINANIL